MEGKELSSDSRKRKDKLATEQATAAAEQGLNKLDVPAEIPKKHKKAKAAEEELTVMPAEIPKKPKKAKAAEDEPTLMQIPKKPKKAKAAEEELTAMPAESLFLTLMDALSTYVDQKAHKIGDNKEKGRQGKQLRSRDIAVMEKYKNRIAKVTEELLKFDKCYAASARHVVLIARFLNKSPFTIASGVMEDPLIVEKIRDKAIEQGVNVQE